MAETHTHRHIHTSAMTTPTNIKILVYHKLGSPDVGDICCVIYIFLNEITCTDLNFGVCIIQCSSVMFLNNYKLTGTSLESCYLGPRTLHSVCDVC